MLAISILGTGLWLALVRAGGPRWRPVLFLGVFACVVYYVLPPNPDPVHMPAAIVEPFRWLSLAGLTLFWAVLGLVFGLLVWRTTRQPARRPQPAFT